MRVIRSGINRPLSSYGIVGTCFRVIFNPVSFVSLIRYLWQAFITYMVLQFKKKFHLSNIPVRNVDHLLDTYVPFRPDKVSIYMNFVRFWIQPLTMLYSLIGYFNTTNVAAEYMDKLRILYKASDGFYRLTLTTTNRPEAKGLKGFAAIHILDPHLLCVPSLHISIILMCYTYFRRLFSELASRGLDIRQKDAWIDELYRGAIDIAETVLYVKQHSVNCIAAALYMMTVTFPDYVGIIDCVDFIGRLFLNAADIGVEHGKDIREYILFIYERFLLEGCFEEDWKVPVYRWIEGYTPYTGGKE